MTAAAPTLDELDFVADLSLQAGEIVMSHFDTAMEVGDKKGEPVTAADRQSNALIVRELRARFPGDEILAEESLVTNDRWRTAERLWIVDPLDGTSDFVAGRVGFAVMIGLAVRGRPVLGAVHCPLAKRTFLGLVGEGAQEHRDGVRIDLSCSPRRRSSELRVIASIAHRDEALERGLDALAPAERLSVGSVGLKVGMIAADEADLYLAPTSHISLWDTCAPEAILHAAGGRFVDVDGAPLHYRGPHLTHRRGLLATNGACLDDVVGKLAGLFATL